MLLPLFQWLEGTGAAAWLRTSVWAFPVIQATHLLGLCVLGGAVLIVDLRLLGFGLSRQEVAEVIRHARPWLVASLILLLASGVLMLLPAAAERYYANTSFRVKMAALPVALLFTFVVRETLVRRGAADTSLWTRLAGAASITLWTTVAAAGRWIGFS